MVVSWAGEQRYLLHPLSPVQEKPLGHHQVKNNHLVRKYAFYCAMTPPRERAQLSDVSWSRRRLNYPDHQTITAGMPAAAPTARRRRLYVPGRRWTVLAQRRSPRPQQARPDHYKDSLNPAGRPQNRRPAEPALILARKTEQLCLANIPPPLPDIHKAS